jgi:hypothetical protein
LSVKERRYLSTKRDRKAVDANKVLKTTREEKEGKQRARLNGQFFGRAAAVEKSLEAWNSKEVWRAIAKRETRRSGSTIK